MRNGNLYSCNHMDMVELDGYSVHVPGVYDWYLYFNTYAEWTRHCMDRRFKAKMFHYSSHSHSTRLLSRRMPFFLPCSPVM